MGIKWKGKILIWTRVCIGCLSPRQSDPGVNELQARDEPWLALPKYKMSNAAKTWPCARWQHRRDARGPWLVDQ